LPLHSKGFDNYASPLNLGSMALWMYAEMAVV